MLTPLNSVMTNGMADTDGFGLEKAINNELGCKFESADVLILVRVGQHGQLL